MLAEHVIGLSYSEYAARFDNSKRAAARESLRQRFQQIQRTGVLQPRGRPRDPSHDDHGSSFGLDLLAGDGDYVFLSYGPRYRNLFPDDLCYGFLFDAVQLVQAGALVGPDLIHDYEELAHEIAEEVDARLPALPEISDEELEEFAGLFGTHDEEMLTHIRQQSTSRYHDIIDGMRYQDRSVPGAKIAMWLFRRRVSAIQSQHRKAGEEALALLRQENEPSKLEILFPDQLPLAWSVGTIQAGQRRIKS